MRKKNIVLYADDDVDDRTWVEEACKEVDSSLAIQFVENGREVLTYLSHLSPDELPSLIVLDLNMPEMDGRQTLQKIKSNPAYKDIPVAIVTTSSNRMDKQICQRLGAKVFLTKPDSYHQWKDIIKQLQPFI